MIHETLANGMDVVLKENHFSPTVAIQVWVNVGSLNEQEHERGMAHFIEHMLFKGTDRRVVGEIAATVEGCGGEINAYTTFDHTVFHLTLAGPHTDLGIDLLFDAFAHSRFAPEEFDREKEVVLEEIRRGLDSPGSRIGRRVFELGFAGSEAGRPIIGSAEGVGGFTRDALYAFYRKWYQPQNATLLVVGDFDSQKVLKTCAKTFGAMASAPLPPRPAAVVQPVYEQPQVAIIRGDFQQPRLELVYPAPALEDIDSTALDLAAFGLGSGEMSRLNRRLRDGAGLVTAIGASVYSPLFGGLFEVSALAVDENIPAAVRGLASEIERLRLADPITQDELERARANLRADRIYRDETVDGQARSIGYGMMTSQKWLHDDVYTSLINGMPATAVRRAVSKWLQPHRAVIVALVNESSTLTEAELLAAYAEGVAAGARMAPSVGIQQAVMHEAAEGAPDTKVMQLAPGIRLVCRQNAQVPLFTLTAATEGGLRAESRGTAGLHNAMSGLMGTATASQSFEEVMGIVEGLGASLEGFSGKDSLGFHVQCLSEHADKLLPLFRDSLLHPVFPAQQWQSLKRELEQSLASQSDSPSGVCLRRFQEMLFGQHPYGWSLVGTEESLATFDEQRLLAAYLDYRDQGPWVFSVTSPFTAEDVAQRLTAVLAGFSPRSEARRFASEALIAQPRGGEQVIAKDREQTHISYGFKGLAWKDKDRAALDVLVNVLGGHGGRLFKELRDRDSLAYTVSPMISYGVHPGVIGSYIACAPTKAVYALKALKREMLNLASEAPTAAELERAKNHIIGTHDMGLQKSDAQTSTMALMELYGYGYDDFLIYPKTIAAVTTQDVFRVAQRLFRADIAAQVVVGPEV